MPRPRWEGSTAVSARSTPGQLGVPDHQVAVEDRDRAGDEVVAGPGPVGDQVGLLDLHRADVLLLLRGHQREDGAGVGARQRTGGETGREGRGGVGHGVRVCSSCHS